MLPYVFRPTPKEVQFWSAIIYLLGVAVLLLGSCLYARGIGYPAVLGLISLTVIGLLVLMVLPDRLPEVESDDA
jgi:hypothetical protein